MGWRVPSSNLDAQAQDDELDDIAGLTLVKGDILVHDGVNVTKLSVGTNDHVLTADSTQPGGVKWAPAGGGDVSYAASGSGTENRLQVPDGSGDLKDSHFTVQQVSVYNEINGGAGKYLALASGAGYGIEFRHGVTALGLWVAGGTFTLETPLRTKSSLDLDAMTAPATNPTSGARIYWDSSAGELRLRDSGGTVYTIDVTAV